MKFRFHRVLRADRESDAHFGLGKKHQNLGDETGQRLMLTPDYLTAVPLRGDSSPGGEHPPVKQAGLLIWGQHCTPDGSWTHSGNDDRPSWELAFVSCCVFLEKVLW